MKIQMLTLTVALSAAVLVGCQAPPQVATSQDPERQKALAKAERESALFQPAAYAQWSRPQPQRIEFSDQAVILVFENTRTEIPWRVVDSFIEDRTRWYIRPEGGETQPARLEGTP